MEGESQISVHHFLTHNAEKFRTGTLRCFANFRYRKILGRRQGAGFTTFRRNRFLSQYRNVSYRYPPVLCFRKIQLAKSLWIRGGGWSHKGSPSKNFCLTVPKILVECFLVFQ